MSKVASAVRSSPSEVSCMPSTGSFICCEERVAATLFFAFYIYRLALAAGLVIVSFVQDEL